LAGVCAGGDGGLAEGSGTSAPRDWIGGKSPEKPDSEELELEACIDRTVLPASSPVSGFLSGEAGSDFALLASEVVRGMLSR